MPYDPMLVAPMREELTRHGVSELLTAEEVDSWFGEEQGSGLLVINSVCGCAAGQARPGVALALRDPALPNLEPDSWEPATEEYGGGNKGTPGDPNRDPRTAIANALA